METYTRKKDKKEGKATKWRPYVCGKRERKAISIWPSIKVHRFQRQLKESNKVLSDLVLKWSRKNKMNINNKEKTCEPTGKKKQIGLRQEEERRNAPCCQSFSPIGQRCSAKCTKVLPPEAKQNYSLCCLVYLNITRRFIGSLWSYLFFELNNILFNYRLLIYVCFAYSISDEIATRSFSLIVFNQMQNLL